MKKISTIFLFLFTFAATTFAQTTQLNQSFTAPFVASSNGWFIQNNSNPIGPDTWAQGVSTVFPSYSGGGNDYFRANYNCQGTTSGDISCFLVTPTVSLMNGGVLSFYTRVPANPASFADHMEVLMSIGTGTGNITPGNEFDTGTFNDLLIDINQSLSLTGYPGTWTQYSVALSSISGTVTGRFAFRYQVYDGGPNGTNSNYVGIDNVMYTTAPPCATPNVTLTPGQSLTICPGNTVALSATGATSYTWYPMVTNGASVVVNPSSTTIYTLAAKDPTNCASIKTITVTIGPPPTVSTATTLNICPGSTASLTATGANSYSWSNGATGSVNVVTINTSTTFVVTGSNGPGCSDTETISISSNTFLVVNNASVTACPGNPIILGAGGALTYNWSTSATTPSIVVTPSANAVYTVTGNDGTCNESKYITVNIDPNMYTPSFTTCAGTAATLIATGAQTYSWSTGSTSSVAIVAPSANSVYTITGTSGACSVTRTVSVTIGANLSVIATQSCIGTSLILSAYGANSYTWLPINDFNQSVIVTPTAATIYTLMGKAGTCVGSKTFALTFCAGIEEVELANGSIVIYPNPFSNELKIAGAYGDYKVVNMLGKLIMTGKIEETTTLHTEAFDPGVYFVIITDPVSVKRKVIKVIKN